MIWNLTGPLRPWPGAVTTGMGQATGDASAAKQYGYCWRINRTLLGFFSSAPLQYPRPMDVRRRTQESTISEIVSREIDPVLFIASHQRKIPCSNGTSGMFTYGAQSIIS